MAQIKISDYIAGFIEGLGVEHMFVVSGGGNVNILDSVSKCQKLKYVCNHHEQASAMAAEAYSRVSGNIGVCCVTFGPGSTNAITGVSGAWLDSIPVLYISGQVGVDHMKTSGLRQLGVQESDIVSMVKPITKYAEVILKAEDIRYHLEKAVFLARSGRPGPVWLDIPMNLQSGKVEENLMRGFDASAEGFLIKSSAEKLSRQVSELIDMLKHSKRPLLLGGHGIRVAKARDLFEEVVIKLNIPVVTSMSAHDLLSSDHPLFTGRPAVFGDRAGNFAVQNADLLLAVGARMHLWNIGYNYKDFARGAKKVVVDIDEAELTKKTISPNFGIHADAKDFLAELGRQLENIALPDFGAWRQRCLAWREKYQVILPEYKGQKDFVNSYYFIGELSKQLQQNEVIFTGVGASFTGTLQSIRIKRGQSFNCNVGCAAMGYDLPAAIGACFANGQRRVVLIVGEGGIMMNMQELQTIFHHHLPIKIFLLNNNGYLSIKNTQNNYFQGRYNASELGSGVSFPDFKKVADAFSISYTTLQTPDMAERIIREVLGSSGPILCDIAMSPIQPLWPRLYADIRADGTFDARPIEDLYPFIDREEFKQNMTND